MKWKTRWQKRKEYEEERKVIEEDLDRRENEVYEELHQSINNLENFLINFIHQVANKESEENDVK